MPPTRRIRIMIATIAVALLIPAAAFGQTTEPTEPAQAQAPRRAKAKARNKKRRQAFPMSGEAFTAKVGQRLKKMGARLKKRLAKAKIPPKAKKQIRADFIKGAKLIRKTAARAAADGKVTSQEAQKVRQVAKKVRQRLMKKWRRIAAKRKAKRPASKD